MSQDLVRAKAQNIWWAVVSTGVIAIIFGLMTIIWPRITLGILILIFGICVIVAGIVNLIKALDNIKTDRLWWLTLVFSLICIGLGIYLLVYPPATIALFVILLAIFLFAQSFFDFVVASYSEGSDKWLWVVTGLVGVVFGFVILFNPAVASLAFVWALGAYALVHGAVSLFYAFRIRAKVKKTLKAIK